MKKKTWILVIAGLLAIIAGALAMFSLFGSGSDAEPIAVAPSGAVISGPFEANGTWEISAGSLAGYQVDEILNGKAVSVVGNTDQVSGRVTVADNFLTEATIEVDMASIETDSASRDAYFRNEIMSVDKYPKATFSLTEPVELTNLESGSGEVNVTGDLTIAGKTLPYGSTLKFFRTEEGIVVTGTTPIKFADFGIKAPSLGFVKVDEMGQIEFKLILKN